MTYLKYSTRFAGITSFIFAFVFTSAIIFTHSALAQSAKVNVSLSPAGSFVGETKDVNGNAEISGDTVTAKNIIVNLKTLTTGIEVRDKHTQEHLETPKFPEAKLISATGKNGKGTGKIEIRGITKDVEGTYTVEGSTLTATFPIIFSDFGIKGIRYMGIGVKDKGQITVNIPVKKATLAAAPAPTAPSSKSAAVPAAKSAVAPAAKPAVAPAAKPTVAPVKKAGK